MRQLLLILLFSNGNVNLAKHLQLFIIFSPTPPHTHTHTHTPTHTPPEVSSEVTLLQN